MAPLTTIWEVIDRSIFEVIRLKLVAEGYLPDITLFDTSTPSGLQAWKDAIDTIIADKGFYIQLYGAGSNQSKNDKSTPRIVYIPRRIFPGDLGGNPERIYTEDVNGNTFSSTVRPPQTSEFQFDISLVSKRSREERVLNAIMGDIFSKRAYIPFYTNTGDPNLDQSFFCTQYSFRDQPNVDFGLMEKVYSYQAVDIWDKEFEPASPAHKLVDATIDVFLKDEDEADLDNPDAVIRRTV